MKFLYNNSLLLKIMIYFPEEIKSMVSEYVINPPVKIRNHFVELAEKEKQLNPDVFTNYFYTNSSIIYWSGFKNIKFNINVLENLSLNKNPEVLKVLKLKLLELKNLSFDFFESSMFVEVRTNLSSNKNPEAVSILESIPELIDWSQLSSNPFAISLLEKNTDKIDWFNLSNNKNAIPLLEKNKDKIDLLELHFNENSSQIILKYFSKNQIDWDLLLRKCIDIDFLVKNYISEEKDPNRISRHISANKFAIDFLKRNPQYIDWKTISWNENGSDLIKELLGEKSYKTKLDWMGIFQNKNLIWLIKKCNFKQFDISEIECLFYNKNPDIIPIIENMKYLPFKETTFHILANPGIFELDKQEYNKTLEKMHFNCLKFAKP